MDNFPEDTRISQWRQDLDWTAKQGRILTDSGNALHYYSENNGFPFSPEETPHHHLEKGVSHSTFRKWAKEKRTSCSCGDSRNNNEVPSMFATIPHEIEATILQSSPIIGAWDRPLFAGKWEHSTNNEEIVYNIQTGTLFVDLRIPRRKPVGKWANLGQNVVSGHPRRAFESLSDDDLRLYARQHVFGGYSMLTRENTKPGRIICTRHHCIDWNYVRGKPRPRPNKWYIDTNNITGPNNFWKESSYSTDEHGQSYYFERWQRINGDENGKGLSLAMRKRNGTGDGNDGILVVVGDHFNYILGRQSAGRENTYPNANNLTDLVDSAIAKGDRETAISYLSLDGGHGTVSSGWKIDCSIRPWNHGRVVFDCIGECGEVKVVGNGTDFFSWEVTIGDTVWDIYESTIQSSTELEQLLKGKRISQSRL